MALVLETGSRSQPIDLNWLPETTSPIKRKRPDPLTNYRSTAPTRVDQIEIPRIKLSLRGRLRMM
jgi:hypothetical protein